MIRDVNFVILAVTKYKYIFLYLQIKQLSSIKDELNMSNITVAALLASEGEDSNSTTSYVVKNEEGQLVNVEYSHRDRYYGEVSGEGTNTILNPDGSTTTVFSEAGKF